MKKLVIYLDTSVINFLFADDAPEKRDITNEFFEEVAKGKYDVYISDIVIDEISKASEEKKEKMLKVINEYHIRFFDITEDALDLSKKIMEMKIVPGNKIQDALHIAIAVCNNADVLLSWNFKHLANINKERQVKALCLIEGYDNKIELRDPMGVISDD